MQEAMHLLLKFSNAYYYNVDTIKEHMKVLDRQGAVIWGLIKPDPNSKSMASHKQQQLIEQMRDGTPTFAFLATHGQITHKAKLSQLYSNDEVMLRQDLVPDYYRKDLARCVLGFEFSSIEEIDVADAAKIHRYGGGELTLSNQTNPLYASYNSTLADIDPSPFRDTHQGDISGDKGSAAGVDHKDIIKNIYRYINSKGFVFSEDDIANFYLSLKTKPFVIMAGISGTGKSKLVRLFAESIGATSDNGRFRMISVKPDWNDSSDLFGYVDLNNNFNPGELSRVFLEASKANNQDSPFFVCLDEMNLARVEQYLSEYLSIIESRKKDSRKRIVTDRIFQQNDAIASVFSGLTIPDNVYIIGTVNMDDTTFAFSRKVLDRANTIENTEVLLDELEFTSEGSQQQNLPAKFLSSNYLTIRDAMAAEKAYVFEVNAKIVRINEILSRNNKHFGYRIRDEIVFYMLENKSARLLSEEMAFDYQIMQKILPTLSGSDSVLKRILIDLHNFCNDQSQIADNDSYVEDAESGISSALYVKSAKKIISMMKGYENGFVSYWQ